MPLNTIKLYLPDQKMLVNSITLYLPDKKILHTANTFVTWSQYVENRIPDQKGLLVIYTRLTWWKAAAQYTNNTYWHTIEYIIYTIHLTRSKDAAQYTHYRIPDQKMVHNIHTLQLPDQKKQHNTHPECPAYCMQEFTPWQSAAHCQYSGRCVCERVSDSVNCHSPTQLQPS